VYRTCSTTVRSMMTGLMDMGWKSAHFMGGCFFSIGNNRCRELNQCTEWWCEIRGVSFIVSYFIVCCRSLLLDCLKLSVG